MGKHDVIHDPLTHSLLWSWPEYGRRSVVYGTCCRFIAVVASFVARTKLLNVEPG